MPHLYITLQNTSLILRQTDTMQITLKDFFRNPDKTGYKISPDGVHLSWLAGYENRLNIFIRNLETNEEKQLTFQTDRDVHQYFWLNNATLGFMKDNNGDENYHLYRVLLGSGEIADLTPFANVKVDIVDELEDKEDEILIMMNRNNPVLFDVYNLVISTGEINPVAINPGNITGWQTDHTGAVRLATATDGVNTSLLYRDTGTATFTNLITTNFKETLSPLFFDFDNEHFYALSNINRDKLSIVKYNPRTNNEVSVIYAHDLVDKDSLNYSKKRKVITTAAYTEWKVEFVFFDEIAKQRYEKLKALINDDVEIYITDYNKAETIFIIRTISDNSLGNYYIFYAGEDNLIPLANISPWLKREALAAMEPIQYVSRDGLTIHGYLTLPKNSSNKNLPLVVNPHGGPWVRDIWRFNPEVQFLASRGYAVLQVNYRGSTGYGKQFWEAGFKQWGKKMQDDITDGVNYLISEGIADKERVAIYGASYGGYATLAGLTFTPDLYTCGIDYVGVSNLFSFMETIPPYWEPYLAMMYEMVGHPELDKDLLAAASPLLHINKIKAPLFVAQGAMDPRVKKSESDQIVAALRDKNIDVQYMVKENEGHGFSNEENRFEFYAAMEIFLNQHLNVTK